MALFIYPWAVLSLFCILPQLSTADSSVATCQELNTILGSVVIEQDEPGYAALSTEHWSQTACESPTCIFHPQVVGDLQKVVSLLVTTNTSFAIRSGGHDPNPGDASINDGVLIDLSNLTRLDYDQDKGVAVLGTGLRWGQVYSYLEDHNVTVGGGRAVDVGVGGLTLGCGLTWLADLYGLACDNVVDFEIVLADGTLAHANNSTNTDLFWALKGGGNNFGVVTAFTYPTYPIKDCWGGFKRYSVDQLPDLLDAYYQYQTVPNKDPYANLIILASPTNATDVGAFVGMLYLKPEANPAAFAPFYDIPTTSDDTTFQTLLEFIAAYPFPEIQRFHWATSSFTPEQSLYGEVADIILNSPDVAAIGSVEAGFMASTIQPLSASAIEAGNARGGNALGLSASAQTLLAINSGWWSPADDGTVHDAARNIVDSIDSASKAKDSYVAYTFMNDASWDQQVIASYGTDNVSKLKQVQSKYDPNLVFQKLVPGGFKLATPIRTRGAC